MASPLSDRAESKPLSSVYQTLLSQFQGDWVERLNVEQMFILIDGVLPFEACLYYQVLPLFLEGSRLNLGMVSPDDTSALDYVRRIISYLNYSLVPRPLSSEALQAVLSAYLHHAGSQRNGLQKSGVQRPSRGTARARADQQIDRNAQQTLIVDSPEDLNLAGAEETAAHEVPVPPPQIPFTPAPPQEAASLEPDATIALDSPLASPLESPLESHTAPELVVPHPDIPPPSTLPTSLHQPLPALEVQANYLSSPVEVLATLSSRDLLQELLGRVLVGGIGRLYFERQAESGRILWSQNGVLQSVLHKLDPEQFQGVINELKQLAHLPMMRVQKPKQVEIERLYQNTRLLLRFRVMLSSAGEEEATLQVLRGAALKFYQQQQLANLERDAIGIAKQLQLKVNEIRDRARSEPGSPKTKLDALPALNQMLRYIEEQLDDLQGEAE
jgi:Type II secretion system (T2SS), protein E, N-terminal domain